MTQLEIRRARVAFLTRDTAVATGTIAELQAVLDAADRSGRLRSHDSLTPMVGEPGVYVVNLRLVPRPDLPVRASASTAIAVRPTPGLVRQVQRDRRTVLLAVAAAGVPVAGGLVAWGIAEAYEEITRHLALVLGGVTFVGVVVLIVGRLVGGSVGCEGVHVRH